MVVTTAQSLFSVKPPAMVDSSVSLSCMQFTIYRDVDVGNGGDHCPVFAFYKTSCDGSVL